MATVAARVEAGKAGGAASARRLTPRSPGGVRVPPLPGVGRHALGARSVFTGFSQLDSVEAFGRTFANDNAPTLTRKAIDAERDAEGEAHVVIRDELEQVFATQTVIPSTQSRTTWWGD